ncbi:MAG: CHAP domain-containing protein [Proteobacteria bacterium]|nr:CHAP domain-containing protein [Pseudomonadota bacterium]
MKFGTVLAIVLLGLTLSGCSTLTGFSNDKASGYRHFTQEQCVPYARRVSGINLRGDAHTWWASAEGVYKRGNYPAPGAILVLSRTNKLRHGHLAVVTEVLGPRTINVTHTNWGNDWLSRRVTYQTHRVEDVSPNNTWTSVRFWNNEVNAYGFPYAASGFIYNTRE